MLPDRKHDAKPQDGPACRWTGGPRDTSLIDYVVIHSTESDANTAQAVARYGATTDRKVSWHYVIDNQVAVRQVPDDVVAWTAPPCNTNGLHIELCGRASWSKYRWFLNQASLKRAAWVAARWCRKYQIPPAWLTDAQLLRGVPGFTYHGQVSRVFRKSDHTDPGPNFPRGYFLFLVRRRINWLDRESL